MSRLADAIGQIVFARRYTLDFLDTIPPADWFRMPAEGVTHVAWQVGHLAFAQYRLVLERVRGLPADAESILSPAFLQTFGRDSVVEGDPAKSPSVGEIRAAFDRVHTRIQVELATFPESDLESPTLTPHRLCKSKLDCLR